MSIHGTPGRLRRFRLSRTYPMATDTLFRLVPRTAPARPSRRHAEAGASSLLGALRRTVAAALLTGVAALSSVAEPVGSSRVDELAEAAPELALFSAGIRATDLERDVGYLASDALAGRYIGTAGVAAAEEYIRRRFAHAGLERLGGDDDHFWDFRVFEHAYDPATTSLMLRSPYRRLIGEVEVDMRPLDLSGVGVREGALMFAGYGITAPEYDYDDYAELDVDGKIVLVLRHEPNDDCPDSPFAGTEYTRHAYFRTKARNARRHGAVAMVMVTDPAYHAGAEDFRTLLDLSLSPTAPDRNRKPLARDFLAVHASQRIVESVLRPYGYTLTSLQDAVDEGTAPAAFPTPGLSARVAVQQLSSPRVIPARNVVGLIRGKELPRQYVIVGAHHDHLGRYPGDGDTIYNGADDNASGVAALLEIAQWMSHRENPPRRSVLFVAFSAEEEGLYGARAAVKQDLVPTEQVGFMVNMDMLGRNPELPLEIWGDGYARGIRGEIEKLPEADGVAIEFQGRRYNGAGDFHPYYESGVPFLDFHTGLHADYHTPADEPAKLQYGRLASVTRLIAAVVHRLATMEELPAFVP